MANQYFDSAIPAAAGYPQYSGGPLSRPIETDIMMAKLMRETVYKRVTNMDYMGSITGRDSGDTVEFMRPGDVQVQDYQKNQKLEYQTLSMEKFQLGIDRSCYYGFKVDKVDDYQFGSKLDKLRDHAMKEAKQKIDLQIGSEFFSEVVTEAASHNKGKTAGKQSACFDMGAVNTPRVMNDNTILPVLTELDAVLDEAFCPQDGRFVVLPTKARVPFMNNDKLACANQSGRGSTYLDNYIGEEIRIGNINVIFSPHVESVTDPGTGSAAYNILAGHKDATAMGMQFICPDEGPITDVDYFGLHWRYLTAYGFGVMRPECLVHLYASIDV